MRRARLTLALVLLSCAAAAPTQRADFRPPVNDLTRLMEALERQDCADVRRIIRLSTEIRLRDALFYSLSRASLCGAQAAEDEGLAPHVGGGSGVTYGFSWWARRNPPKPNEWTERERERFEAIARLSLRMDTYPLGMLGWADVASIYCGSDGVRWALDHYLQHGADYDKMPWARGRRFPSIRERVRQNCPVMASRFEQLVRTWILAHPAEARERRDRLCVVRRRFRLRCNPDPLKDPEAS